MADKYYIFDSSGATPCGDGTASNVAASAGAPGAWSDSTGAILHTGTPAYGTLSAGDVVHIRSKDQNGDTDITFTLTAVTHLGNAAGTVDTPIRWIIDDGTVWSGISGTITWYINNAPYYPVIDEGNIFIAAAQDAGFIYSTVTNPVNKSLVQVYGGLINYKFDNTAKTGTYGQSISVYGYGFLENPTIKAGRLGNNGLISGSARSTAVLINPDIELTYSTPSGWVLAFSNNYSSACRVYGGRIYGVGATTGQGVFYDKSGGYSTFVETIGLTFPIEMDLTTSLNAGSSIDAFGMDGSHGTAVIRPWGWATSRSDNNPPYLNAILPDSGSTPWAWRVYPESATAQTPVKLPVAKTYTNTDAVVTLTVDFLVATGFSSPDKGNVWIEGYYIDATTGYPTGFSTREHSSSPSSLSAGNTWSSTTWGTISFTEKKISFTTPTSVKQDTPIMVNFCTSMQSGSANDILFVDPAIQIL